MKQARLQTVITHEDELRCEKEQPIKNFSMYKTY